MTTNDVTGSFNDPSSTNVSSADRAPIATEEIELLRSHLPNPRVESGDELLHGLEGIPEQLAFKIGEAAEMVGVKQYVLRYWETEFDVLKPRKSKNNQRIYTRRDVETAMMIKKLLYEDRFSIEGARSALRALKSQVKEDRAVRRLAETQQSAMQKMQSLVGEIRRLRDLFK